jgi:hypothetical protein
LIWKIARQDTRNEGERKRKKKTQDISVKSKSKLCFLHTSSQYEEDTETNLMMFWNDILSYRNQSHTPPKDDGAVGTHQYFFNPFDLLKDKTNPYNFTTHYLYNNKNTLRPIAWKTKTQG